MKYYIVFIIAVIIYKWVIDYMVITYLKKQQTENRLLKISVKEKIRNIWRLARGNDHWLMRYYYPLLINRKTLFCFFRYNLRVESILILILLFLFLLCSIGFVFAGIIGFLRH